VVARVREWRGEDGWGVLWADEIPGDIFLHFSNIQMEGHKSLRLGERVEAEVMEAVPPIEGCRYVASVARPLR
jgi:CspA family cold shock protein